MSGHTLEISLEAKLTQAQQLVKIREHYVHYKNPNNKYVVLTIGLDEQSEEVSIIYQAEYGKELIWIRPLADFLGTVKDQVGKDVPRFSLVENCM